MNMAFFYFYWLLSHCFRRFLLSIFPARPNKMRSEFENITHCQYKYLNIYDQLWILEWFFYSFYFRCVFLFPRQQQSASCEFDVLQKILQPIERNRKLPWEIRVGMFRLSGTRKSFKENKNTANGGKKEESYARRCLQSIHSLFAQNDTPHT